MEQILYINPFCRYGRYYILYTFLVLQTLILRLHVSFSDIYSTYSIAAAQKMRNTGSAPRVRRSSRFKRNKAEGFVSPVLLRSEIAISDAKWKEISETKR